MLSDGQWLFWSPRLKRAGRKARPRRRFARQNRSGASLYSERIFTNSGWKWFVRGSANGLIGNSRPTMKCLGQGKAWTLSQGAFQA
jgi:hypothetical protein